MGIYERREHVAGINALAVAAVGDRVAVRGSSALHGLGGAHWTRALAGDQLFGPKELACIGNVVVTLVATREHDQTVLEAVTLDEGLPLWRNVYAFARGTGSIVALGEHVGFVGMKAGKPHLVRIMLDGGVLGTSPLPSGGGLEADGSILYAGGALGGLFSSPDGEDWECLHPSSVAEVRVGNAGVIARIAGMDGRASVGVWGADGRCHGVFATRYPLGALRPKAALPGGRALVVAGSEVACLDVGASQIVWTDTGGADDASDAAVDAGYIAVLRSPTADAGTLGRRTIDGDPVGAPVAIEDLFLTDVYSVGAHLLASGPGDVTSYAWSD